MSVAITSYYTGDVKYIRAKIEEERTLPGLWDYYNSFSNIEITTVNAYIGGEAQVNILVTDVTRPNEVENQDEDNRDDEWLEFETPTFIFDNQIGTVAISRASDLLIVIGHIDYLTSQEIPEGEVQRSAPGQVLTRFLHHVAERAPVLNYSPYLQRIKDASPRDLTRYDSNGIIREPNINRGIIQTCRLNEDHEWYAKLRLERHGRGQISAPRRA